MSVGSKLAELTGDMDEALGKKKGDAQSPVTQAPKPKSAPGQLMQFQSEVSRYEARIAELEKQLAENLSQLEISLDLIDRNPEQPRIVFDQEELLQLAKDIRDVDGVMQPIVLRPSPVTPGRYQLVAGERRVEASKLNGYSAIPAVVREVSDGKMAFMALIENIGRAQLSDFEISRALARIESNFPTHRVLISELRLGRSSFYRFKAFQSLPEFVLADLEVNPRLLGGAAAEELKLVLDKLGDAGIDQLRVQWRRFLDGKLSQANLAGAVVMACNTPHRVVEGDSRQIHKLFFKGNQAGSITKDAKTFSIKIKAHLLTPEHESKFRELAALLYEKK